MNRSLKLYSFWACPFAQRAWIGLEKSGLEFEYVELNPYISRENADWNKGNFKNEKSLFLTTSIFWKYIIIFFKSEP